MNPTLWNLLHDGRMERIHGTVPGDIVVDVSIHYLRQRFPGEGTGFVVRLADCTHFVFTPYDEPAVSNMAAIMALTPWIVSSEPSDPLEVHCAEGVLLLCYDMATLSLDSGETITLSELDAAAKSYWQEFSERTRASS